MSGYRPPKQLESAVASNDPTATQNGVATPTTEEVVAVSVAADIATAVNLPIATNVANLSRSLTAQNTLARSESSVVAKPQIIAPESKSRAITSYVTKAGDTVSSLAKKFAVSERTIRWANNIDSDADALSKGTKLTILPVDGVVHKVARGDTINSIAKQYGADADRIRLFNDLDLSKTLKTGSRIVIPSGVLPEEERPGYVEPQTYNYNGISGNYGGGYGSNNDYNASVGNRYVYGECTWYVYERRAQLGKPVGSLWGNASTWAIYARLAGYRVDLTPEAGAVMQNGGGSYGHVAIVESVDPGKSVTISEMNAYRFGGGWNIIGHGTISWSDAVSGYYQYIH